ncbi:MAG: type II toxin-antitoxin system HicA family toxin [Anaerolineaceae bacterium]
MNTKQAKTLQNLFERPIHSDIVWSDIENLLLALGATISEGSGSRIRVELNGRRAVFHRPHPERISDKGLVKTVCEFLKNAGVKND